MKAHNLQPVVCTNIYTRIICRVKIVWLQAQMNFYGEGHSEIYLGVNVKTDFA